jgi:hypothetical protein
MTVDLLPPDRPTQPKRPAPLQPRGLEESRRFERVMRSVAQAKEDQKTLQEKSDISDANAVLEPVDESADRGDATAQGVEGETVVAVEAEGGTESEAVVDGSATGVAETPLEVLIEAPVVTLEHLELKSGEALVSASSGAAFLASVVQSNSLPGVSAALTAGGKPVATDLFTKEEGEPLAALVPEGEPGASVYAQLATSTAEPEASAVRAAVTGVASVGAEGGVQLAGAPAAIALNGGFVPVLEALPVDLSTVQGTRQIEQ